MKDWIELEGNCVIPGGTPMWMCPECGMKSKESWHIYGIEYSENRMDACPHCGISLKYPWEKE